MSMKLSKAIAKRSVIVKNTMSGEAMLHVGGKSYTLAKGQKLDLTKLVGHPKECLKIKGLTEMLRRGQLALI